MQIQPGQLGLEAIQAEPNQLREIIKTLLAADSKTQLVTSTGLDLGENLGAYYHMRPTQGYLTIKIQVPKSNPKITSIADLIPGATFAELEATDLLGIVFEGTPLPGHFFLSENWPDGVYPLRKGVNIQDVKLNSAPPKPEEEFSPLS